MVALPPVPPVEVRTIDFEIQAPNTDADALRSVVVDVFGIQLNEKERVLTLRPTFPASWQGENVAISTADFDFSCQWSDNQCTWEFEGFGDFATSYDSIVVWAPQGTLMSGELSDSEGVNICYYGLMPVEQKPIDLSKLSKKERKALEKQEKERKKREKALAKKKK